MRGSNPFLYNSKEVINYVNMNKLYLYRQFVESDIERVQMPTPVAILLHIYGASGENGLSTFDIDGILTTVMEMLQPPEVSKLGVVGYYDNDRQVRYEGVTSVFVPSRKFEHTLVALYPVERGSQFKFSIFDEIGESLSDYGKPPSSDSATSEFSELLNEFNL